MNWLVVTLAVAACFVPETGSWCTPDAGRQVRTILLGYDSDSYFALETTLENPGSYYRVRETMRWIHMSNDGRKLAERVIADVDYADTTANGDWRRRVFAVDSVASSWYLGSPNMRFAGITQPNPAREETLTVGSNGLALRGWGREAPLTSREEVDRFLPLAYGRTCNGLADSSAIVVTGFVDGNDVRYIFARIGEPCCIDADAAEFIIPISTNKVIAARKSLIRPHSGRRQPSLPRSLTRFPR